MIAGLTLTEDEIKKACKSYVEMQGYSVQGEITLRCYQSDGSNPLERNSCEAVVRVLPKVAYDK